MKKAITLITILFLFSCSNNIINQQIDITSNKVTIKTSDKIGAKLSLQIGNLTNFKTKASVDGNLVKKFSDVKSFRVWLCTNPELPITSAITTSQFDFDKIITDNYSWVDFINVPAGGPYYAVVSAYDDLKTNSIRKNITKEFTFATDGIQKLAVSSNSITVNSDFTLEPLDTLKVELNLSDSKGNIIETQITPIEGGNGIFGVN
ncbi:MAG: hypothetical protein U0457_20510 [Candidatus Sericytochromatia bacterium]